MPSGRLLRVFISLRPRVHIPKVDPDASLLRLETPAPRPLLGAGDCAWSGRGECGRPPDGRGRTHARRNVSAPPGLHALKSRRDLDRPGCGRRESVASRPVRVERARPHPGATRGAGRVDQPQIGRASCREGVYVSVGGVTWRQRVDAKLIETALKTG